MKKALYILTPIIILIFILVMLFKSPDNRAYTEVNLNQLNSLIKKKAEIIVFIKKDGCSHCEQVTPIINDYAKKNNKKVYSITINRYKNMSKITKKFNVPGTPVIIFYKGGKEKGRLIGGFTGKKFYKYLNKTEGEKINFEK